MSTIKVIGNTIILTSALKKADIELLEKLNPSALKLVDEEKEPYFMIGVGENGSVTDFGITFASQNTAGNAIMTSTVSGEVDPAELKEAITDTLMKAVANLNKLEETIPSALASAKAERNAFINSITFE